MTEPLPEGASLEDLFDRDPDEISDSELDRLVDYYRQKAADWLRGDQQAAEMSGGAKRRPKVKPSLDDLGDLMESLERKPGDQQ